MLLWHPVEDKQAINNHTSILTLDTKAIAIECISDEAITADTILW